MSNQPNQANHSNAALESEMRSRELSALIADWLALYAGNYGKEPTEETILAYKIGLSDLRPKILHKAFGSCLRECVFWPTVAEIRKSYRNEADTNSYDQPRLVAASEPWSDQDRDNFTKQMQEIKSKLTIPPHQLSEADLERRKEVLRKQAEDLKTP